MAGGLAGPKGCVPRPLATTGFPARGFRSLAASPPAPAREDGVEPSLAEAWFLHEQTQLVLAQSDPGVWDGAWREAWPGPWTLLLSPALVGPPRTAGRPHPHALCGCPGAPARSAPGPGPPGPAGPWRSREGGRGGFGFLSPAERGDEAAAAPRGRGWMHGDRIHIIDGETFGAGARRSGSQSLPSAEVGGPEWVAVAVACVRGWGHLTAPGIRPCRFPFASESSGRGRETKD